jgi:hypothetical protein
MNLLSEELNLFHFVNIITFLEHRIKQYTAFNFYRYTVHFDIYKIHTLTNAIFIELDKVLKFTLKSL